MALHQTDISSVIPTSLDNTPCNIFLLLHNIQWVDGRTVRKMFVGGQSKGRPGWHCGQSWWQYNTLHYTVFHFTSLYCTALYWTDCTALQCLSLQCRHLHWTCLVTTCGNLMWIFHSHVSGLQYTSLALHKPALNWITLKYTKLH